MANVLSLRLLEIATHRQMGYPIISLISCLGALDVAF